MPSLVYDFLYVDISRIARLVAQLDGKGILQEVTREFVAGGSVGTKLNLGFWEATLSPKADVTKGVRYDPRWRLPVVFLDEMQHHIVSDPSDWKVGQLITLTGSIAFRDFPFAGELLKIDSVRSAMQQSTESKAAIGDEQLSQFQNAAEALPHMLQAMITSRSVTTWSTVNDAFTTASTGDLILKCGERIEGEWTITGILDSTTDRPKDPASAWSAGAFSLEFDRFGEAVRAAIGRPDHCFGVTPLTIHRRVEVPTFSGLAD